MLFNNNCNEKSRFKMLFFTKTSLSIGLKILFFFIQKIKKYSYYFDRKSYIYLWIIFTCVYERTYTTTTGKNSYVLYKLFTSPKGRRISYDLVTFSLFSLNNDKRTQFVANLLSYTFFAK